MLESSLQQRVRRLNVQFLYQMEINETWIWDENLFHTFWTQDQIKPECLPHMRNILLKVIVNNSTIESLIQEYSKHWKIFRMNKVDLAILKACIGEMLVRKDANKNIIINDAVNIAKEFSAQHSYSFVNGILDALKLESKIQDLA
jgi:N utilization substance protein B